MKIGFCIAHVKVGIIIAAIDTKMQEIGTESKESCSVGQNDALISLKIGRCCVILFL